MKVGVVVFPGSNCDEDALHVVRDVFGHQARLLWHKDRDLHGSDYVILPGGFSYGDYLRCGAIARFSPVMEDVAAFAKRGGPVLGICNGFQILTEAGLLPGALLQNAGQHFLGRDVLVRAEGHANRFTTGLSRTASFRLPIAHMDGRYFIDEEGRKRLEDAGQVAFRYVDDNPNGSLAAIAGVVNAAGNVLGLMPHPERNSEALLGNLDGRTIFAALLGAA
jgi:phosphoribosylformylglycinamidine synthase subunit PurQ / glutaminase